MIPRTSAPPAAPVGLMYQPDFLSPNEQQRLMDQIQALPLAPFTMRGVTSKRLVLHLGWDYNYDEWRIRPAPPLPDFLVDLRRKACRAVNDDPDLFEEALINGYPPGSGIGWHRDAPMFGSPVIGVSLGSACIMRFRRKQAGGYDVYKTGLAPGSLYAMSGEARSVWQHTIPATKGLRYSVTFRKVIRRPG